MFYNKSIRLINVDTAVNILNVDNTTVDFQPAIKFKVNKVNAFDPTKKIQRGKYHEDTVECSSVVSPEELEALNIFLDNSSTLYIEYQDKLKTRQLPVEISKLPKSSDDSRFFTTRVKFSFKSSYTELTPINFDDVPGWGNSWGLSWGF